MSTKGAALIVVWLRLISRGLLGYLGRRSGNLLGSRQDDGGGAYRSAGPEANCMTAGNKHWLLHDPSNEMAQEKERALPRSRCCAATSDGISRWT